MTAAAIRATFADFRLVKGRKCAQLVFELPLEAADAALDTLGGLPRPDVDRWCAIARLAEGAKPERAATPAKEPTTRAAPSLSQRVAMRCQEPQFRVFLARDCRDIHMLDTEMAADDVRDFCGVKSRSEILPGTEAARKWEALEAEFFTWRAGPMR